MYQLRTEDHTVIAYSWGMRSTVLRCAHNCMYRISVVNGRSVGNALAMVYEYLHFCQFKSTFRYYAIKTLNKTILIYIKVEVKLNPYLGRKSEDHSAS